MSIPSRTGRDALLHDTTALEPRTNRVLAALTPENLQAWLPFLRPTHLLRGQVLPADQAFFPTTATVSLFASTSAGDSTEVAMIGNEGFVGTTLLTGSEPACEQAEVTGTGHAFALPGSTLRSEFLRSGATMQLLLRYLQLHMAQTMQRAVCVQHHSIEQRLCRCLLESLDRGRWRSTIELTHQSLAARVGVRRETITARALHLQGQGIITYRLGVITVHDSAALRACSCPCYGEARSAHDRLLPPPAPGLRGDTDLLVPGLADAHFARVLHRNNAQNHHDHRHQPHAPAPHHDPAALQRAAGSGQRVDG